MQKKINIVILIINIVLLVVFAVKIVIVSGLDKAYTSDNAKRAWDNDTYKYGQISLYMSPDNEFDRNSVYTLENAVTQKLVENSIALPEGSEGRLWIDAWYSQNSLTISGNMGKCDALAAGTGGDFFMFHPLDIMYGSYYSDDDVNLDRIVLDKTSSWQIFGAVDTIGMPVAIGDKTFYVAAVVDTPTNETDKVAYGDKPHIYLPYASFNELAPTPITSYEICLPDIIDGFAYNIIKDANPAAESTSSVVDQSDRFNLIALTKGYKAIPESVMVSTNLSYPWFENIIRSGEIRAQMTIGYILYFMIFTLISAVYGIYLAVKLAGKGVRKAADKAESAYQKRITEEYNRKHK